MKKTVMITGATAGFGEATAIKFAQNNFNLIITGRRKERLEQLEREIKSKYGTDVISLCFDVRKLREVKKAIETIHHNFPVDVLINNAGLAVGLNTIDEGEIDDWERMIDTNIKGLLYVSRLIIPEMKNRKSGHIINISSTAGKEVYFKGNVYCATKHAVDALSKAMRIDLLPYGIKVTNIAPGAAETEFSVVRFKGDSEIASKIYEGFKPLAAIDLADIIYFTASQPAHVCINDLVVTPTAQANAVNIYKEDF